MSLKLYRDSNDVHWIGDSQCAPGIVKFEWNADKTLLRVPGFSNFEPFTFYLTESGIPYTSFAALKTAFASFFLKGSSNIAVVKPAISDTHANLIILQNSNGLVAGQDYLINDFATKYNQPVTGIVRTEPVEMLFLTAISDSEFHKIAKSPSFPEDIIYYDINDILCEDGITARKGKINRRIDTVNNNDLPHDFSIRNRRYKVTASTHSYMNWLIGRYASWRSTNITINGETLTVDSNDYIDAPTLCRLDDLTDVRGGQMKNVIIKSLDHYYLDSKGYYSGYYPNINVIAVDNDESLNINDVKIGHNSFEGTLFEFQVNFELGFDSRHFLFKHAKYSYYGENSDLNVVEYMEYTRLSELFQIEQNMIHVMSAVQLFLYHFQKVKANLINNVKCSGIVNTEISGNLQYSNFIEIKDTVVDNIINSDFGIIDNCQITDFYNNNADNIHINGLDLTASTHAQNAGYTKQWYMRPDGTIYLSYLDNSNTIVYALPTS